MKISSLKTISIIGVLIINTLTHANAICSSDQEANIKISRLDKALFQYIETPTETLTKSLVDNYPQTLPALAQTLGIEGSKNDMPASLSAYFSHPTLKKIYKDVINRFDNIEKQEKELTEMSNRAQRELGMINMPQFSVHVSGFKENTIYINNTISLSIDKYMGSDYPQYKEYFRNYQLQQMQPKMITRDFTKAWLIADYIKVETTNGDLLSEMIEQGKLLYSLSLLLPQYTEYDLIGYTTQEYNWCVNNHKRIWNYIIKQNYLYTTDRHIIHAHIGEIPDSKVTIKGSPGQIGSWIGLQIVKQYVKETKQPLRAVLNTDPRNILKNAKYRQ